MKKITSIERPDRPTAPFGLRWWVDGKARHKFFDTEDARAKWRKTLEKQLTVEGEAPLRMTAADAIEWSKAKEMLEGKGVSVVDAVQSYLNDRSWVRVRKTLPEAIGEYLTTGKMPSRSPGHLRQVKMTLEMFTATYGDRLDLSPDEIQPFIDNLPFDALTKANYRKRLSAFFRFAGEKRWIVNNPMLAVHTPDAVEKPIGVLTVEQTRFLFRANEDQEPAVLARLALEAFAGLRYSSAVRIALEDIKWSQKGIELPAAKMKTKTRHFIEHLPPNLWSWLRLCLKRSKNPADWQIHERAYLYQKTEAFARATRLLRQETGNETAEVPHPKNALRHSFATYHCAAFESPGRTALILCHRSEKKLWAHYKGHGTAPDGRAYFKIKPTSKK